jgi:hypothetical protein
VTSLTPYIYVFARLIAVILREGAESMLQMDPATSLRYAQDDNSPVH